MEENIKISSSSKHSNCEFATGVKVYGSAELKSSKLGVNAIVGDQAILIDSELGECVSLNRRNYVLRSQIGKFSYTGIGTMIRSAQVGNFCSISWNVSIGGGDHDYEHVTTSPLWRLRMMAGKQIDHSKNSDLQKRFEIQPDCIVGNDVWIATNVVILRGVKIGNGAVIGAGAIVTRDVEPYSIVVGIPAKAKKKRFNDETIQALEEIAWWDWPTEVILENSELIYSSRVDAKVLESMRAVAATL